MATGLAKQFRIQYRRTWSNYWSDDPGTVAIAPWEAGCGNRTGSVILTSHVTAAKNREAGAPACPLELGQFVRVVERPKRQPDGSTATNAVHWTGWIRDKKVTPRGARNGAGGSAADGSRIDRVTWSAVGLAGLLAQIDLGRVWCGFTPTYDKTIGLLGVPRFSAGRRADRDGRSVGDCLYARRGANGWTFGSMLDALLLWHLYEASPTGSPPVARFPAWPTIEIGGLVSALDVPVEDVHLTGKLSDAVTAICNPRRGLTWRIEEPTTYNGPINGPITLRVMSVLENPIIVSLPTGGTRTIPASDDAVSLDATDPHRSLEFSSISVPRRLTVRGRRRVAVVNLRWSRDSGGAETGALTRTWLPADDDKAGRPEPQFSRVFRSFTLRPGWNGSSVGTSTQWITGLPDIAGDTGSPDILHGVGGLTGTVTYGGGNFPDLAARILDQIPMPCSATDTSKAIRPLTDWLSGATDVVLDTTAEPLRPTAFVHHRSDDTWARLNVSVTVTDDRTVQVGTGPKDASLLAGALATNTDDLVILCAVEEPWALAASYEPNVAAMGIQLGGDFHRPADWCEVVRVLSGTVLGLDQAGAVVAAGSTKAARDDTGTVRAMLALARPLGERSADAIYRDRLAVDRAIRPGALVTSCRRLTEDGSRYEPIGYVITSVIRHPKIGTIATIEAAEVDLETIT